MKIKMKVKTLTSLITLTLFIVLIIVPFINLGIAEYLGEKDSDKAEVFYENYFSSPIKLNEKGALYSYGEYLLGGMNKYTIMASAWGGGGTTTPKEMEKARESFKKSLLLDEKKDYKGEYSTKAYSRLLDTSIATLDIDELLYWIKWGRDKENKEIKDISKIYEAYYYYAQRDYNKAEKILEETLEEYEERKLDFKYYLMGDISLSQGNMEKAKGYFEKGSTNIEFSGYSFGGSNLSMKNLWLKEYENQLQGDYKIRGKVSHAGKGLPFVEVYLHDEIGVLYSGGMTPIAITDENGEFETLGFRQGVYDIGIGLNTSQLYDKVYLRRSTDSIELNSDMNIDFKFTTPMEIKNPNDKVTIKPGEDLEVAWEEVEGADYYSVLTLIFAKPKEKSGSMSISPLIDQNGNYKIKENNAIFNMERGEKNIGGLFYEGEDRIVNPTGILGVFIPDVEYPIVVDAYDEERNLIGSSSPIIRDYEEVPSIKVKGELTEGERLIGHKKYEKAISYYEEKLKENPKDEEALLYLSRFYMIGWKRDKKDFAKALKYSSEYDKLKGNVSLLLKTVGYMTYEDIIENSEEVKIILDSIPEENRDTNYYSEKGRYHLSKEEFSKARESYEKMTDYKPSSMLYIDMYLEDYEKAISTLESGEIKFRKLNTKKVIEALKNIDNVSREDKKLYNELLRGVLSRGLSREAEKSLYEKTYKSVSSQELKEILKEISKERYWDEEY